MEKLTLKELAPYLPYRLKWHLLSAYPGANPLATIEEMTLVGVDSCISFEKASEIYLDSDENDVIGKPILRPLSDLTKEIEIKGKKFIPHQELISIACGMIVGISSLEEYKDIREVLYWEYEQLIEWHFDVFGLIEKGLAIDINTLPATSIVVKSS